MVSSSTKRMIMGDMLTKYYHTKSEERDSKITEALKSIEDDEFYDLLYDSYGRGWSIVKASRNNYCSETTYKRHRAELLDKLIKYLNI
jgi:hypothetical protein